MTAGTRPGRAVFQPHHASTIGLPMADSDLTLGKSLRWSAERYGDREALVFEGQRWTYRDLLVDAERCAQALIAVGVVKGTHVGVLMGGRPEFLALCYGVAMAGGISVLISTFSTAEELDWILQHSDASIFVTHSGVRGRDVANEFVSRHAAVLTANPGEIVDPEIPKLRRVVVVPNEGGAVPNSLESWSEFVKLARLGRPRDRAQTHRRSGGD